VYATKPFYILISIFFSINFHQSYGQSAEFSGHVKDSLNNPLPYANVIAKPKDVSKNLQFSITDNEGYYKLFLEKGDTITLNTL
jgi:hypothetical protein